ncbi:MAG: AAA family ATPase [Gammaproteobacteria bacterium]|nr:AAA family ATPase [Gammaproteobacteria bacterium]
MANTTPHPDGDRHAGLLSEEAMIALQLRTQPFTGAPADGDWFADDSVREQLGEIKEALISGDDLLLITGDTGSGKSVLLKQLSSNSGPRIQCFSVRGSPRFSTYNLFSGLLEAFKLTPPVEMEDTLKEVVPCMQALLERNTLGVIVLDDADLVKPEELARLLGSMRYLNSGEEPLLRVLLAAKPAFEEVLPDVLPAGDDLPYATLSIEPFDEGRTIGYLDFRLNQAGHFEEFPFSDKQLSTITEHAGGSPAGLNIAAATEINELYAPAALRDMAPVAATTGGGILGNRVARSLLAVAALALIAAGLYQFLPQTPAVKTPTRDTYTVVEEKPIDTGQTLALVDEPEPEVGAGDVDDPEPEVTQTASTDVASSSSTDAEPESDTQTTVVAAASTTPSNPTTTSTEIGVTTTPVTVPQTTQTDGTDATPNESAASGDATEASSSEATDAETPVPNLESANWILVQDEKLYTVQMSASRDRESVAYFLQRTKLSPPNSIYSYQRNNETWYALVHGLFPTITAAREAIEVMPQNAKTNQPWIRAVGQIQDLVKK